MGVALISLLGSFQLFSNTGKIKFHGDESGWISSGFYYTNLVLHGDFDWKKWECSECSTWGSYLNPHLGQWIIGIPLTIFSDGETFFNFYDFAKPLNQNRAEGRIPPHDILFQARIISSVFGILCCLVILGIGYLLKKPGLGIIATFFLLINDLFITYSCRAMVDVTFIFFLLCSCLATTLLLKHNRRQNVLVYGSICGILAGLAASIKVSGLVIAGLHFLLVLTYVYITKQIRLDAVFKYMAIFSITLIIPIYLLNPYYWPSFDEIDASEIVTEVKSISKDLPIDLELATEQYPQLFNLAHVFAFPYSFIQWNKLFEYQSTNTSFLFKSRFLTLNETLFRWLTSIPFEYIFFFTGIISIGMPVIRSIRSKKPIPCAIPLFFFTANYIIILFFMRLNWDRYYLPTVVSGKLVVAGGIYNTGVFLLSFIKKQGRFFFINPLRKP